MTFHVEWTMAETAIQIPEFFSWAEDSSNRAKYHNFGIAYVTEGFYDYVETGFNPLPPAFLADIKDESEKIVGGMIRTVEYAAVITDGERVLAVYIERDPDGAPYYIPIYKSRLVPQVERQVLQSVKHMGIERKVYRFKKKDLKFEKYWGDLTDDERIGLTAREILMKQFLLNMLEKVFKEEKNPHALAYWYTYLFPEVDIDIAALLSVSEMKSHIRNRLLFGWERDFEEFGRSLAASQGSVVAKLWEIKSRIKDVKKAGAASGE
jgi:Protein of unknown function (DUF3603)